MIFAWVLFIGIGTNMVTAIPGIATEAECHRLATATPVKGFFAHQCIRYQLAK